MIKADWLENYETSKALWENGRYDEAKNELESFWDKTGAKTLPQMTLYAYILRSKKLYISEIKHIEETLELFKGSDEKRFLAILYSLLGEAYQRIGKTIEAAKIFLIAAEIEPNAEKKFAEISNAIFARGASDFSPEEMEVFYKKYRDTWKYYISLKTPSPPSVTEGFAFSESGSAQSAEGIQKIRIGYMSPDLHAHPVADFSASLFFDYDREKFEIYVYDLGSVEDEVTQALKQGINVWRNVYGLSFDKIAQIIKTDEIDILVDLSGHTAKNALPVFMHRAAPIQLSGIGYVLSTGLYETDGFLTDIHASSEEKSEYFVEKLIRLPHTHFCYTPFATFPAVKNSPCIKNNYITFGSFNNFSKVTDECLILWNKILKNNKNFKLILKHSLFDSKEGLEYTKNRINSLGISTERIEFRGFSENYLEEYNDVDIALDTFPYTGGATSLEALMMGVPLVTLCGIRHGSRFGVSFLENLNLNELIAKDKNSYVEIASYIASDKELLLALRQNLRQMMLNSPLMDRKSYMKDIERIFQYSYESKICSKLPL
ncbi:MAG: hypothetical protein IKN12_09045 [Selenomonadaceae bacterium]|nr:hypothetical protein [Selenomonadaceae bacterium]